MADSADCELVAVAVREQIGADHRQNKNVEIDLSIFL